MMTRFVFLIVFSCISVLANACKDSKKAEATARMVAAMQNSNWEQIFAALNAGADVNARGEKDTTVLMDAVSAEGKEHYQKIMAFKPALGLKNIEGMNAMHLALARGNIAQAMEMRTANRGQPNPDLAIACGLGNLSELKLAASLKKPSAADFRIALWVTVWANNPQMLAPLKELGADLNATIARDIKSVELAVNIDRPKILAKLIELGADVNASTLGGIALHEAIQSENKSLVTTLLNAGANLETKDQYGRTALLVATAANQVEVVKVFLKKGADLNAQGDDGNTAVMIAAQEGEMVPLLKVLLADKPNLKLRNGNGKDALTLANDWNRYDAAELITEAMNGQ